MPAYAIASSQLRFEFQSLRNQKKKCITKQKHKTLRIIDRDFLSIQIAWYLLDRFIKSKWTLNFESNICNALQSSHGGRTVMLLYHEFNHIAGYFCSSLNLSYE